MPMKWPTGAPVICGGPPPGKRSSSWRVSQPMVRCECTTPFGSRVVPDVNATSAGASGSTVAGSRTGSASSVASNGIAAAGSAPAGVAPATSQSRAGWRDSRSSYMPRWSTWPNRSAVTIASGSVARRM